ncbi:phage tail spike protein [Weissella paramesenteroides]|uniref:phage tail spike protein n=1 Tax=Weissella paramesenteroides TaxID=1249 RepID=UPI001239F6E3|nr:phage tail spike protein [Weissella paramesenteroides]KAA8445047.1 hypothetical protein FKV72_07820 [Weissella paramesenteroides]KAA8452616.1 hypothetical protein FKV71_04350 [Weissella paramesenteroides]
MIPILYKSDEVDFYDNGLGALTEIYNVDVQEQRNGLFTLNASYPVSGKRYKDIEVGRIILAKTNPNKNDVAQAFRIVNTELDISGYALTIEADHITYDLTHNLVGKVHMQGNGQNAMTALQNATQTAHQFHFISDLEHIGDSTVQYVNPMEAIAGTEGSILQIWGGELKRDNRTVSMLTRRGRNNFTTFRLGKNINGLKYTVDMSNVVTRIVPTATTGDSETPYFIVGDTVDSKNIGKYANVYIQHVDMSSDIAIEDGDKDEQIKAKIDAKAKNWFTQSANTGVDLPAVTVEIDVASLQDSADYQDEFKDLEAVELTDTVTVYVPEFGVNVSAIVNEFHYDPMAERITSIVVGTVKQSFADANANSFRDLQNKLTEIKQDSITAVVSANGKNTNYYGANEPKHPIEGDLWYKQVGDETYLMIFKDGHWVELVSTRTQEAIADAVDKATSKASSYADSLNATQASEAADFQAGANAALSSAASERESLAAEADSIASSAAHQLQLATSERAAFSSAAASMANSAASRADSMANSAVAYGKAQANSALSSANDALATAKQELGSEVSKAQSDIVATNKELSGKVSQSDYDKKTQELSTQYGQIKATADAVNAEVARYESANDKKVSANTASINILNNQITSKVSQTDYDKETKDLEGKYSETKQTVDSISNIVTELQAKANAQGQVNQLMNTEFTPDFQGWDMSETWAGTLKPYRSIIYDGSNTVGLNTQKNTDKTYTTMKQLIPFTLSGSNKVVSVSWQSIVYQVDQYSTVHVRSYDANMTRLTDVSVGNWGQKTLKTWGVGKFENISIPDNASFIEVLWSAREGFLGYMEKPMLVFADHVGDYVPGNYNNNARVAELEVSLDGITGLVKDPKNGLSATATLAANGMTVATNAQFAASTAIQKADGIQTTVESMQAINQFTNTEFTPDLEGWTTTSTDGKRNPYKSYLDKNVKAMTVGFYTVGADTSKGNYFAKFQQTVPLTNSSNGYLSLSWQSYLKSMDDGMYGHLWVIFHDKDGNVVYNSGGANKMGNWISNGQATWTRQKMEKVEIPNVATSVDISFEAREGISAYLVRPMIVFDDHIGDVYVAGPYNNNSSMQSIRTQLADQITDEVEDRKTGDKSTVTQLTGVINQKVVDITQGYTSLNTQTSQLFETKIKNVADQVNSMGQVNQLTNTEFMPDLEGWESITEGGTSKAPYRSYWQGNIQATVVGFDTRNAASNTWATFKQNFQLASSPGTGHQISMSWASWASQTNNYNGLYARFFDKSGTKVGESYREWSYTDKPADNAWLQRKKWEGIDVPDTAVSCTVIFQAREGTLAYLGQPMVVLGSTIGSYTPGPYNNNNLVESTRTQLAGMIQDKVDDVGGQIKSLSTQTAGQFTTEIQDRKDGDTNTLTQANKYTVSQIKDARSGLKTEISQSANGIIASVSQVNRLFNTQFTPDLQGWNVTNNGANGKNYNFYRSYVVDGETTVGINVPTDAGDDTTKWYSYFEQDVAVPGNNGNTVFSLSWDVRTITNTNYTSLWFSFLDSNHKNVNSDLNVLKYWNGTDDGTWYSKKVENISVPTDAKYIRVSFQCREGTTAYLKRPMLVFRSVAQPYMPGSYMATDTVLRLFKDNWAVGIADNVGLITSGIIGDTKSVNLISDNVTIKSPSTQITGKTWITSAMIKDGAIGNAQIGNAAISSAQIINVDVSKISGNIANFITTNVNTLNANVLYGNTGHLGTTDTGRVINKQDNHLQLASKGFYDSTNDRAQLELLNNSDSSISDEMKGSFNYYGNPTDKGHGLGIRMKYNQILAIDEDGGSKNLYLSPYSGGQVRIVSRDLSTYYDIAAAHFNVSSQRKFKTNITDLEDNALEIVNNTKIHRYTKNGQTEIGLIADEADDRLLSDDGKFVSIYDYTSVLYKAVQELSQEIEALKNERSSSQQLSD